jgi:myo-inositol-1(or 4)-monophosphatase
MRGSRVEEWRSAEEPRLAAAGWLARLGGKMALRYFQEAQAWWKDDDSLVTEADFAIQSWLDREIASAFPEDGVLGEEASDGGRAAQARHVWIIDPVDGTNNFGRGIPGFAVSVGVLRDGLPFVGAVYDPLADQLFTGCAGRGAGLNGRPLRVAAAPLSGRSLFSIRAPYDSDVPVFVDRWLCRYRLRRFGSTALQLCYVATGALAFVHDQRASLWDIAGAAPILLEAGAVVTTPGGADLFPVWPDQYHGEPIALLAGDPLAHAETLEDVSEAGLPRR